MLAEAAPSASCDRLLRCVHHRLTRDPFDWKGEFSRICSRTGAAPALSAGEIDALLVRSDALMSRLLVLDEPAARVYRARLAMCRDFFEYSRDLRDRDAEKR